jgi:hypothetical protein
MTRSPLRLSDAVTLALPTKSALIAINKSPTVSLPVDAYVVVLPPALIVTVPPALIPSVDNDVLVVSGAVPVPTAGEAEDPELGEDEDEEEPVGVELPDSTLCIAAVNSEWTRFKAVSLAMLAKPLPKLVSAELIAEISASLADKDAASLCWLLQ